MSEIIQTSENRASYCPCSEWNGWGRLGTLAILETGASGESGEPAGSALTPTSPDGIGDSACDMCPACGEPQEWASIPVPGLSHYQAAKHGVGLVRNNRTGRVLVPTCHNRGYGRLDLSSADGGVVKMLAHVAVLTAFSGPCPEGMETRHLNGSRSDNCYPRNIIWGTKKQNGEDRRAHGTSRSNRVSDITGQRFGQLVAVSCLGEIEKNMRWNCVCDCGASRVVRGDVLRAGNCRACRRCILASKSRRPIAAALAALALLAVACAAPVSHEPDPAELPAVETPAEEPAQ